MKPNMLFLPKRQKDCRKSKCLRCRQSPISATPARPCTRVRFAFSRHAISTSALFTRCGTLWVVVKVRLLLLENKRTLETHVLSSSKSRQLHLRSGKCVLYNCRHLSHVHVSNMTFGFEGEKTVRTGQNTQEGTHHARPPESGFSTSAAAGGRETRMRRTAW